jgi:hypothetical protein
MCVQLRVLAPVTIALCQPYNFCFLDLHSLSETFIMFYILRKFFSLDEENSVYCMAYSKSFVSYVEMVYTKNLLVGNFKSECHIYLLDCL